MSRLIAVGCDVGNNTVKVKLRMIVITLIQ